MAMLDYQRVHFSWKRTQNSNRNQPEFPFFFVGSVRSGRHFPRDSAGALRERASTSAWQASQDLAGDEVALLCLDLRVRWTRLIYIYIVIAYFSSRFSLFGVYPQLINQDLLMGGWHYSQISWLIIFSHMNFGQTCMVMVLPKLVGSAFVLQPEMIWDGSLWCGSYFWDGLKPQKRTTSHPWPVAYFRMKRSSFGASG